ncbi:MAG: ABC transporter permease [Mycobacteriales bacterium]
MRRANALGLAMIALPMLVITVFIGLPIVLAVAFSLGHTGGPNSNLSAIAQHEHKSNGGLGTTAAYHEVLSDHQNIRDLIVTIVVTLISVIAVLVASWAVALYLRLSGSRLAKTFAALSVVPLFIPVVIASYAIRQFYNGDGFFRGLAHHAGWSNPPILSSTTAGITLGEIWVSIPFAVLMISSGLAAVPDALIEAARDAGASLARTVRTILVPMCAIPTVIAVTFTAIGILGSFTVPYLTGPASPNMLGVTMQHYFSAFAEPQQAEVLAVVVFVIASLAAVWYVRANATAARRSGATS